ncbi:MAG: MMPL family transporter [Alphaproteobacteria bacterium]|nr:MMPL family transporter [Alphaproteobacteria bacterium]
MRLSEISVRRPVFATVINLLVVLLGLIAYDRLEVREYPDIDVPIISVETRYPGASAKVIESQVTVPLEEELAGIDGIDYVSSVSRAEKSEISIRFNLDRDEDDAAADVRDRVSRARGSLPDDIDEPVISKTEADASALIWTVFYSDRYNQLEVTETVDRLIKDRLQILPGVAKVVYYAPRFYAMRIWLDREKLAAYGLTPADVEDALQQQNVEIPAGRVESSAREFTVLAETDLNTPRQFEQIVLKDADGYLVRVKDVAQVELGSEENREIARYSGRNATALGVVKQSQANPLAVAREVKEVLPRLLAQLPEGMTGEVNWDKSVYVDASINAVFVTIGEAFVLVLFVIFLFLGSLRATLIPLLTIPISLTGAFFLIYAFGFSINSLTLLAMVVAIGLVVDDAIIMLENIHRRVEGGLDRREAAIVGSREIGFAIVAMTLTLVAVFAPVAFTPGRMGKLFTEFALTLAGAVLISGFVALTLTPMMCSRMLARRHQGPGRLAQGIDRVFGRVAGGYRRLLTGAMRRRNLVFAGAALIGIGTVFLYSTLRHELSPPEDRGFFIGYFLGPEGATPEYMERYAAELERLYMGHPDVQKNFYTAVGRPTVNQGYSFVLLQPWNKRKRHALDIIKEFAPKMAAVPGVLAIPNNPGAFGSSPQDAAIDFVIQTTGSYEELNDVTNRVIDKVSANPGFAALRSDLKLNKPELKIDVDRSKAAAMGVRVVDVGRTLETMLGSRKVTHFKRGNKQYDVILKVKDVDRRNPETLRTIFVRNRDGQMIPLENLVRMQESVTPRELNHFDKLRAATITANLVPGYSLGEALDALEQATHEIAPSMQIDYKGNAREFKQSGASMAITFLLALGFIYLFLSAQFESFVDPLIIMLTVPLAMGGALATMHLTGGTLNVYSQIGLIALIGLITKHGILIVEFANRQREQGLDKVAAVIEAAVLRLRPILMTTGAMVLGAIPLALATGAGAESRHEIGWVLVGGLTFGTLFTLFIVPAFYILLSRRRDAEPAAAGEPVPAE